MNENSALRDFGLDGRRFVVTGGSSGIGRAMAGFLAEAGARVVLVARREDQLAEAVAALRDAGHAAEHAAADLLDREGLPGLAKRCRDLADGDIDGVVNAAGLNPRRPPDEVDIATWDATLNLNLSTPFFLTREFVPGMRANGYGRVINIASLQSYRAFPNGLPYGASKAGVCQLTRAMAEAWSRYGICCNAIAPGFFPTELTAAVFENEDTRDWAAGQTAIGRNGELDDLRGVTIFFASPASGYITGQTLAVDGGFTAR